MGEPWPRAGLAQFQAFGARGPAPLVPPPPAPEPPPEPASTPAPDALQLYAELLTASTLADAAHRLVATLARDGALRRATLAWHEAGRTRLLASSHLDLAHAQAELPQLLLGAVDEAIEQARSLCWPPDPAEPVELHAPIVFEQKALQALVGGAVAAVPLGVGGEVLAALCVERDAGPPFTAAELARFEQQMSLAVPALRWLHHGTLPWHRRAAREALRALATWRQPRHHNRRRVAALAGLGLAVLALAPLELEVSGRARIEGAEQRVLAAPTDGYVKTAHVRPGDRVKAGDALVDLLDGDLRLELDRWNSQLAQHENAYAAAMARADRAGASISLARIGEAQSQLALVEEQLTRGRVVAPFDALVIQGDLSQSIGAPVRQGDTLVTLATTGHYRVIVEVDETDIARVLPGQAGQLALSSMPWGREDLRVERIAPLAKAVDGRNVFEVEASLLAPAADMRPGLLGRAGLVVGRMPPLWAWSRHAVDRLRVAWWSWLG